MATIQQKIRETFLARLTEDGAVDTNTIERLRQLMGEGKKLKADDLVNLFSSPTGDGVA
jgi:hypothetical protein